MSEKFGFISDPVWAANQRKRLSEGAKNRPPIIAKVN